MAKYQTTTEKRFKILYTLMIELNVATDGEFSPLMDKLDELAYHIETKHPKALEGLCYYEDNIQWFATTNLKMALNTM